MREKLIQYIDLLFAGNPNTEDIKQEILQNTLDRYDDLIAQGKAPESAYTLSIAGIGDIQEILGKSTEQTAAPTPAQRTDTSPEIKKSGNPLIFAAAVVFFILCPIPVLLLPNTVGVCLLFLMVATGVALLIMNKSFDTTEFKKQRSAFHRCLLGIVVGSGIALYITVSLITKAWFITWLIFPIMICTCGLINACFDLNKVFLSAVVRIVVFVILIALLSVCLLGGYLSIGATEIIKEYFEEHHTVVNNTTESTGSVSAQQVKDIEIQWVSGSITLQPGDVDSIVFGENAGLSDNHKMVWKQSGDRLVIQYVKPGLHISLFHNVPSKDLTITVPRDWLCDELEIESVSARIDILGITARSADIGNVSGTCRILECSMPELDIETISGKVDFTGASADLDMTSVSAECTASFSGKPDNIQLETVSGNLTLTLPEDCGFTLKLEGVSGELISDFPTTVQNKRYSFGDGLCQIKVSTVSGDIFLKSAE